MKYDTLLKELNHPDKAMRQQSLKTLISMVKSGEIDAPKKGMDVNNHIHTDYSFSPYSPTKALWFAYKSGLTTAGIMDHDSISGAREFIEAGKIVGMATTIGIECRVNFAKTSMYGRRLNNPDQSSIAYVALHGIPHTAIDQVTKYFAPYTKARCSRNKMMLERINDLLRQVSLQLEFDKDVVPLSRANDGGSITERHLLFAVARKLIDNLGKGNKLITVLMDAFNISLSPKIEGLLLDENNPYYDYDLLGVLKSDLVEKFYIPATSECPDVHDIINLANRISAICAYAYLGDVGDSVTGDKKTQTFEDAFLDELFELLKELGFHAVTYMPSRNSTNQLKRLKALCDTHSLFQISGEDINSPRQTFICEALKNPEFHNLIQSTWALIGHEQEATKDKSKGMFSPETINNYPNLSERIAIFAEIGKSY